MVNTNMHEFKHPKYYTELRKRNKSDQVISKEPATAGNQRAPGPGHKPQDNNASFESISEAEYNKRHMKALKDADPGLKLQAPSVKPQAPRASSDKRQAPSSKRQA